MSAVEGVDSPATTAAETVAAVLLAHVASFDEAGQAYQREWSDRAAAAVLAALNPTETRWRIHDPQGPHPRLYYVFTTENDARTALLALGDTWRLDEPNPEGITHG